MEVEGYDRGIEMKKLLLVFAMFQTVVEGPTFVDTSRPEFWRMVENHCVAVLTEKHDEKIPTATFGGPMPEMDNQGNEIIHVPEQTLKLRCK